MFTFILLSHIILLCLSLGASAFSLVATLTVGNVRSWIITANTAVTTAGLAFGALLLIDAPLNARCAALFAYLIAFIGLQVFVTRRAQPNHSPSAR